MKKAGVLSYPLSAQRRLWSDWADDQTGRMPRLTWVFAGRTRHFVRFVMTRLNYSFSLFNCLSSLVLQDWMWPVFRSHFCLNNWSYRRCSLAFRKEISVWFIGEENLPLVSAATFLKNEHIYTCTASVWLVCLNRDTGIPNTRQAIFKYYSAHIWKKKKNTWHLQPSRGHVAILNDRENRLLSKQ